MSDEKGVATGKRFARDLRRVREDRGVSLATIHDETQIAPSLLESFEEGGLYDHSAFNEVYLRSFVRAYATAVGISADEAVAGLEAALRGTYQNDLAATYLEGVSLDSAGDEEEHSTAEADEPNRGGRDARSVGSKGSNTDATPEEKAEKPTDATEKTDPHERPSPPVSVEDAPPPPHSVASTDRGENQRGPTPVLSIGGALLVVAVIGIGVWYALDVGDSPPVSSTPDVSDTLSELSSSSSARRSSPTTSPPPDTSQAPSTSSRGMSDPPTLGDTLHLTLRADSTVSGLRLRRDEDLRRPYWIQEGEAATFPFASRVIIENDLDGVSVYLEDRQVELPSDTTGRVVLDRNRVSALLENAEGAPVEWSTPPDTIPAGPLPSDSLAN